MMISHTSRFPGCILIVVVQVAAAVLVQGDSCQINISCQAYGPYSDVCIFDGDTILKKSNTDSLCPSGGPGDRKRRAITHFGNFPDSKWEDKQIKYKIDRSSVDDEMVAIIEEGMVYIEAATCLDFIEVDDGVDPLTTHYVLFKQETICASFTGKTEVSPQEVLLKKICTTFGEMLHLLTKLIGLWHTHMRPDRNQFVKINRTNIQASEQNSLFEFQFSETDGAVEMSYPYDYTSIQHFPANVFAADSNLLTLIPTDLLYLQTIGQRVELSFNDLKSINLEYCSDEISDCDTNHTEACQNGGYRHPVSCKCICPEGFGGATCIDLAPYVGEICGGELSATSDPGFIEIGPYTTGQQCSWRIKAGEGETISMWFEKLSIPCGSSYPHLAEHWVGIAYKTPNLHESGPRFCGSLSTSNFGGEHLVTEGNPLVSTGAEALVVFRALSQDYPPDSLAGFKLVYKLSNPCLNGGTYDSGVCICDVDYTGQTCEKMLDCGGCGQSIGLERHATCVRYEQREITIRITVIVRTYYYRKGRWRCRIRYTSRYVKRIRTVQIQWCCKNTKLLCSRNGISCAVTAWKPWTSCAADACGGKKKSKSERYYMKTNRSGNPQNVTIAIKTRNCNLRKCTCDDNDNNEDDDDDNDNGDRRRRRHSGWWYGGGHSENTMTCQSCKGGYTLEGDLCCHPYYISADVLGNTCQGGW